MAENKKREKAKSGSLLTEVADKYTVIPGIGIGPMAFKGKTIDLSKVTVSEVEKLIENGFDVLVPKAPAKTITAGK